MKKLNKKEIEGLLKRKYWTIVCRSEASDDANVLNGRFLLVTKDEGTQEEVWKARFIVQVHRYFFNKMLVHDISVARRYTTKILVGSAAIFGFRLFSTYVTQHTYKLQIILTETFSLTLRKNSNPTPIS